MKLATCILFFAIYFQANATGIAISAGVSIGKATCSACCLPFIKWCSGSIHDALQTDEEREKQDKINSVIEHPPLQAGLAKWNLTNCQITFVGESQLSEDSHAPEFKREDKLPFQIQPSHKIDFHYELQLLIKKTLANKDFKILSLELGSIVRALVFRHDENYPIFTINGAIRSPNSKIFDSLFGDKALSKTEKKERDLLRKCTDSLNAVLKKTEEYADGIYLTVSGRKFYRIGTTHIIPVLHDEIHAITQKVTHRKASFGKVTKKIDGIAPEDLEMFEMDLSSNSVDTEKEETKKDDDDISKTSLRVHTPSPSNTLELQDTVL